jgi:hypothetical protein
LRANDPFRILGAQLIFAERPAADTARLLRLPGGWALSDRLRKALVRELPDTSVDRMDVTNSMRWQVTSP